MTRVSPAEDYPLSRDKTIQLVSKQTVLVPLLECLFDVLTSIHSDVPGMATNSTLITSYNPQCLIQAPMA